jgi:LuxR family maltose regulon positive regulatory protein
VLSLLVAGEPRMRWWECSPPYNWSTIAGMPTLFERYLSGATPRLDDRPMPMRAELHLLRGVQRLWAGDLAGTDLALCAAEEDVRWLAVSGEAEVGTVIVRTIHHAMCGRAEAVHRALEQLIAREDGKPTERRLLWRHQMSIYGVRLSDTLGDGEGLRRWAANLKENPLQDPGAQNPRAVAARARHAASAGRWDDAVALFTALAPKLAGMDVMGQRTDLTLRHAQVLVKLARLREAAAVLAPALDRLIDERVRGQALLSGPVVLGTLAEARWGALLTAAQQAELQAAAQLSASSQAGGAMPLPAAGERDDGLSSREREVLERIAAGDSNKLIARVLDISPHTVKRHVANILDKLGLTSRGQAAAWLREHT